MTDKTTMVKLGSLGVGHLGNIHLKCLQEIPTIEFIGFYDPNDKAAHKAMDTYAVPRFTTYDSLLQQCDAVDIVCLLYTSPSPRDQRGSRMPSSA